MMPTPKGSQSQRFVEKARELECDESEVTFEAKLKKIAGAQATPKAAKSKKKKRP
jgi:hypothetical protein